MASLSLVLLEVAFHIAQDRDGHADNGAGSVDGAVGNVASTAGARGAPRRLASSSGGSGCQDANATAANGTASSGALASADHTSRAFEPITFFILAYLSSAFAQQISALLPKRIRLPHSIVLYLIGLVLARISSFHGEGTEFGSTVDNLMHIDPHVIFWILLPALLYEDSAGVHWHVFKRVCPNALLLAVPGVILNTVLTGIFVKVAFREIEWTWSTALLLGSILSATDPVAVVGALHQLAAPDKLASLISGESLFNDGSAVVLFNLFWDLARGIREFDMGYGVLFFLRMAVGGPLLALAVALVAHLWLRNTERFEIEILVILVSIYGLFFLAEHPSVQVSGVLAVVCFGCYMAANGRFALSIAAEHQHHAVLSFLGLLSNEAIFIIAGMVSYRFGSQYMSSGHGITTRDYFECAALYIIVHLTRAAVIVLFMPILRKSGYGLTWREATICLWGGLRGAVGLAMALLVEHDNRLDEPTRMRIAFHTSGICFGTLLVNGTTVTTLYKFLQIYGKAAHHDHLLEVALEKVDHSVHRYAMHLRQNWFFHNCHLDVALCLLPLLSKAEKEAKENRVGPKRTRSRTKTTVGVVDAAVDELARRMHNTEVEQRIAEKILCQFRNRRSHTAKGNAFLLDTNNATNDTDREEEFALALRVVVQEETEEEHKELCELHQLQQQFRVQRQFREDQKKTATPITPMSQKESRSWTTKVSSSSKGNANVLTLPGSVDPPVPPSNEPPELSPKSVVPTPTQTATKDFDQVSMADSGFDSKYEELLSDLTKRRWKWARRRVLRTIETMREIREETSTAVNGAKVKMGRSKTKNGLGLFLEQCQEDEASMEEVFLTIVSASRAAYKSMVKAQSISVEPYRLLMESLATQEQVVHLSGSKRRTWGTGMTGSNASLDDAPCKIGGFHEGWEFLRSTLGQPTGFVFPLMARIFPVENWLDAQWWLLKRDAEILTAYVMTQEHLMSDLEILAKFPEEVQGPMKVITENAKKQALFALVRKPYDSAMLALFEHVLLARLLVRMQCQLVEQLEKEGALLEEDAHEVIAHVLRPTEKALQEYTPTAEQLQRIGSKSVANYTRKGFKRWLMNLVEFLEFHDD